MLTQDDFYSQLTNLLPPGPAWDFEKSDNVKQIFFAWADELSRVCSRVENIINEADPRTTLELLDDYWRLFGLQTDCLSGGVLTIDQRRKALIMQMVSIGGQSRDYFIALAAAVGYTVTITEYRPHNVMIGVNAPIYGDDWAHVWSVSGTNLVDPSYLSVIGGVGEPLAVWGSNLLTCLFSRLKPAHTILIFN